MNDPVAEGRQRGVWQDEYRISDPIIDLINDQVSLLLPGVSIKTWHSYGGSWTMVHGSVYVFPVGAKSEADAYSIMKEVSIRDTLPVDENLVPLVANALQSAMMAEAYRLHLSCTIDRYELIRVLNALMSPMLS